jgi:hypothetical protein
MGRVDGWLGIVSIRGWARWIAGCWLLDSVVSGIEHRAQDDFECFYQFN